MKTCRVLLSDALAERGVEILRSHPELQVDIKTGLKPAQIAEIIAPYDALVIRSGTKVTREVIEHALAHRIKDKAEASYRRTSALDKRRRLMEEWARYCNSPVIHSTGVVSISFAT